MAKDRYTEERDKQEAHKKAELKKLQEEAMRINAARKEDRVDNTIVDPVADPIVGDDTPVIGLDPDEEFPEEEKVDDTVVNGPAGDMVEIEPNVFTNVDPDTVPEVSLDPYSFGYGNVSGSGTGFSDALRQLNES